MFEKVLEGTQPLSQRIEELKIFKNELCCKMEKEILRSREIEDLGTLAGGIAHIFNNSLTAVLGNLSLGMHFLESKGIISQALTEAEKACQEAKKAVNQLLTFSTGGAPLKKIVPIYNILEELTYFLKNKLRVKIQLTLPENLWWAEIDQEQINYALSNILLNAEQAMPGGGTIDVWTENRDIGAENNLSLEKGKYLKIGIKDRGIGIPEEHLKKIFYPYFTTKFEGSGLGLSITHSIIKKHGGSVTVESQKGIGTTFSVYLPASEKLYLPRKDVKKYKYKSIIKKKILFMDDQPGIREAIGQMISIIGYECVLAKDGLEAVEIYKKAKKFGRPFDMVILDLMIPGGMGGIYVINKLLKIDPQLKAIIASGYAEEPIMAEYKKYGFKGAIAKPFKMKELSDLLFEVGLGIQESSLCSV